MNNLFKIISVAFISLILNSLFLIPDTLASMSSETFTIEADSINLADTNIMNSSNFTIDGQLGEAILGGDLASSNFESKTGFQNVIKPVTPPTPTPTPTGGGGGGIPPSEVSSQGCDTNADGKTDVLDFNALMVNWGNTTPGNIADCDSSGVVDIFDFNLLMIYWTA